MSMTPEEERNFRLDQAEDTLALFANLVAQLKSGKLKIPNHSGGANGPEIINKILDLNASLGTIAVTANAPGDNTASVALIGQKDSSVASKATLDIETEEVVAVVGTFTASHKIAVWINGTEYNIQLDAV